MIRIEHDQEIGRPIDAVFEFAANPENNPRWWAPVQEARLLAEGPVATGSRFEEVGRTPLGQTTSEFEVASYDAPHEVQFRVVEGSVPAIVTERFEAQNGSTRVHVTVQVQPKGLMRLAQPLLRPMLDRMWRGNLRELKRVLEEPASDP